jgi:hypothetical protein
VQQISTANEAVVEKRFRKMGLRPRRLDFQGPRKRPDFLVSDSTGPVLVCEVKSIFSAGYDEERRAHVSTFDPEFLNRGPSFHEIDFTAIDRNLSEAVSKHKVLLEDCPEFVGLPLLVAFFFDPFADHFNLYPREMKAFPEVSGIVKVVSDHLIDAAARRMSLEELKARVDSGDMTGMPPNTKIFELVENECAMVKLPRHFVDACLT